MTHDRLRSGQTAALVSVGDARLHRVRRERQGRCIVVHHALRWRIVDVLRDKYIAFTLRETATHPV